MEFHKLNVQENKARDMTFRKWTFKSSMVNCGNKFCKKGCNDGTPAHGPYCSFIRRKMEKNKGHNSIYEEFRLGTFQPTPEQIKLINASEEITRNRDKIVPKEMRYLIYCTLRDYGYSPHSLVDLISPKKENWEKRYATDKRDS